MLNYTLLLDVNHRLNKSGTVINCSFQKSFKEWPWMIICRNKVMLFHWIIFRILILMYQLIEKYFSIDQRILNKQIQYFTRIINWWFVIYLVKLWWWKDLIKTKEQINCCFSRIELFRKRKTALYFSTWITFLMENKLRLERINKKILK